MLSLDELRNDRSECRYPLTHRPPHFFCGEPVTQPPYCDYCRRTYKPFTGKLGKAWQGLAGMINATEKTVTRSAAQRDPGTAEAIDEVLRAAETRFDEAGGLMRRT